VASRVAGTTRFLYNRGMNKKNLSLIDFLPITDEDTEFLYNVYASTREEEMARTGWDDEQVEAFLRMQFDLQHTQYLQNYKNASFEIILLDKVPIGRLYVDRRTDEIRVIDLSLLTEFRSQGIGSKIMKDLVAEADKKNLPLNLHVIQNNPAIRLYERLGFKKVGEAGFHFFIEKPPSHKKMNDEG
jgi:ribosomal protein S18 acetylase RimI-like enzyme